MSHDPSLQSWEIGISRYKRKSHGSASSCLLQSNPFLLVMRPLWICSEETVWSRAAQGQPGHKLPTSLWRQAVPGLARHKPMLLPSPRLSQEWWKTRNKGEILHFALPWTTWDLPVFPDWLSRALQTRFVVQESTILMIGFILPIFSAPDHQIALCIILTPISTHSGAHTNCEHKNTRIQNQNKFLQALTTTSCHSASLEAP